MLNAVADDLATRGASSIETEPHEPPPSCATPPRIDDRPAPKGPAASKPEKLFSLDAEEAVLSAILFDGHKALAAIGATVRPSDFYEGTHALIYTTLQQLNDDGVAIDPLTLAGALEQQGQLDRIGGKEYVAYLLDGAPFAANVLHYARTVRQFAEARRLVTQLERAAQELRAGTAQPEQVAARLSSQLVNVQTPDAARFVSTREIIRELLPILEEREKNKGQLIGVPSGFQHVDSMTGGFREGELVIIAGVPGSGKTATVLQIALNAALDHSIAVGIVEAEMTRNDLIERAICNIARIDTRRLRTMQLEDHEYAHLARAAGVIGGAPIYIDDSPSPDMRDVLARCRALKAEHPEIKLVVVDFLQLLTGEAGEDTRAEELRAISYGLKALAKELRVAVVAGAQLNDKQLETRGDKRPQLADLQGSSGMRQAADYVALAYREKMYDRGVQDDTLELNFAKCRSISTFAVNLDAQLKYMRIADKPAGGGRDAREPAPREEKGQWWHS